MKILAIIPVRMGSSRFPGKPLKKINGKSMIEIIYRKVAKNKNIEKTFIATCDKEIINFANLKKFNVINTKKTHERASDRSAEALLKIEKKYNKKFDIVLMVQGDEPMITQNMISKSLKPFKNNNNINVLNLCSKIISKKDLYDLNCVKLIKDKNNNAIYFSRLPIPFSKSFKKNIFYKQVCIIPFKRDYLIKYIKMKPTSLEIKESIDMLRIIENGEKVKMVEISEITYPVDTLSDLRKVSKLIKSKNVKA